MVSPSSFKWDDAQQRSSTNWVVKRNWDGDRGCREVLLHDAVASALAGGSESLLFKYPADF